MRRVSHTRRALAKPHKKLTMPESRCSACWSMELQDPPDPRRATLLPISAYSVERCLATGKPDYWNHATRIELAVLAKDEQAARAALADALGAVRESWEPATTARTLRVLREAQERRCDTVLWVKQLEIALEQRARA